MNESKYCPFCQRRIETEIDGDGVVIGLAAGYRVYVHDDVAHDQDYRHEGMQ